MMRGSINEGVVMESLSSKNFVIQIYEIGMIGLREKTWLACSPDSVAWINTKNWVTVTLKFLDWPP